MTRDAGSIWLPWPPTDEIDEVHLSLFDPGSTKKPLPEAGAPDGYVKSQFIVHSTGDNGTAAATWRYFSGATPNESTFIVGKGPDDPTLQLMDSTDQADANGNANKRAISIEVVGDGIGGYNAWQRAELIRLGRWARANHPIAARIIPTESESGFGWHIMFGAPGPWAKGAKICPGKARIKELITDIFPAIFTGKDNKDPIQEDEDIMKSYRSNPDQGGNGAIVIADSGIWEPIPTPAHYGMLVSDGVIGPFRNVSVDVFAYYGAIYMAPHRKAATVMIRKTVASVSEDDARAAITDSALLAEVEELEASFPRKK